MKIVIAWTLVSVLLLPLFVASAWAFLPTVDPVAKAQRIVMMANQVRQITAMVTTVTTLTSQLNELKAQYAHIKDATLGQVQALTQPFTQLASETTGLVSDGMAWKSEFSGPPGQLATAVSDMGSSGTSLTTTWRTRLQQADTVTQADVTDLFRYETQDLSDRGRESWKKSRERRDDAVVMNQAVADAAELLAEALHPTKDAIDARKTQTNLSDTALAQAQLTTSLSGLNLDTALAQLVAYKAAKEASQALADEEYRRDMIKDWSDNQAAARTALQARLTAIDASRDAMQERMLFRVHPFYKGQTTSTPQQNP